MNMKSSFTVTLSTSLLLLLSCGQQSVSGAKIKYSVPTNHINMFANNLMLQNVDQRDESYARSEMDKIDGVVRRLRNKLQNTSVPSYNNLVSASQAFYDTDSRELGIGNITCERNSLGAFNRCTISTTTGTGSFGGPDAKAAFIALWINYYRNINSEWTKSYMRVFHDRNSTGISYIFDSERGRHFTCQFTNPLNKRSSSIFRCQLLQAS